MNSPAASDWVAERWGIGSTRLHLDLQQLALAIILFDRVVLPTPSSETEADRWDRLGWDSETQALRIVQLGALAYFAPWDKALHVEMRDRRQKLGLEVRELANTRRPEIPLIPHFPTLSTRSGSRTHVTASAVVRRRGRSWARRAGEASSPGVTRSRGRVSG